MITLMNLWAIVKRMELDKKHNQKVIWIKLGSGEVPKTVDKNTLDCLIDLLINRGV